MLSPIILLHSCLSDYGQTGDEDSEEESALLDEPDSEELVAKQESIDKCGLLNVLWKIHKGLMMKADGDQRPHQYS